MEIQIVLTGFNYEEDIEVYEQRKRALRKFFGEQVVSHSTVLKEDVNDVEEAHYTSYRGKFESSRGNYRGRGGRGFLSDMVNASASYKHGFNP